MSKATKIWLIVAAALILAGTVTFVGAMATLKWDFTGLETNKYETNEYRIAEDYEKISIVTNTADVTFVVCDDVTKVVNYEESKVTHSVEVVGGVLTVKVRDTRKWYEHIGVNFEVPTIKVYVPRGKSVSLSVQTDTGFVDIPEEMQLERLTVSASTGYVKCLASVAGATRIKTSTGAVKIEDASFGALDISVNTGDVKVSRVECAGEISVRVTTGRAQLDDVSCNTLLSNGDTGDITLKGVNATESMRITRDTGDVRFIDSDAGEIYVETDTGDVTGSLLSSKVFIPRSDTGIIRVPKTTEGGVCEITTDTGDIIIEIK